MGGSDGTPGGALSPIKSDDDDIANNEKGGRGRQLSVLVGLELSPPTCTP